MHMRECDKSWVVKGVLPSVVGRGIPFGGVLLAGTSPRVAHVLRHLPAVTPVQTSGSAVTALSQSLYTSRNPYSGSKVNNIMRRRLTIIYFTGHDHVLCKM